MRNYFFWLWMILVQSSFGFAEKDLKGSLSICAIFKNEAPYLKEWIEYHKLVGVEHFYLYNNGSEDEYAKVLAPYIQSKEVSVVDWPDREKETWKQRKWAWVRTTQVSAYEDGIRRAKGKTKWLALIDVDEFLVPTKASRVLDVLDKYEKNFPAVEVAWEIYGTCDLEEIPPNRLMIEVLHKKSNKDHPLRAVGKTIVKPECYRGFIHPPHKCSYIGGVRHHAVSKSELTLNHYINRCKRYFYSHKIENKEKMDNVRYTDKEIEAMLKLGNDIEDEQKWIQRFVPELQKKVFSGK